MPTTMNPTTVQGAAAALHALPGQPQLYLHVANLCRDPATTPTEVAQAILKDGSATMALLRVANSPPYLGARHAHTVTEAVQAMGLDAVRAVVMTVYVHGHHHETASSEEGHLWRRSVAAAVAAREIGGLVKDEGADFPERCYVAGLLHNIGRLALLRLDHGKFLLTTGDIGESLEIERQAYGLDHAELGAAIVGHWNLPPAVSDAVRGHHQILRDATDVRLAAVVHVAALAIARADGAPETVLPDSVALAALSWSAEDFGTYVGKFSSFLAEIDLLAAAAPSKPEPAHASTEAEAAYDKPLHPPHANYVRGLDVEARMPPGM